MNMPKIDTRKSHYVVLAVCFGLYVFQFVSITTNAVNIPFWDEWEAINKGGILVNQTLSQLFAQHNEHRIVTTKLLTLLLYHFDGWNLVTHQAINFLIYGLLIVTVTYVVKKCAPELPTVVLFCFVLFLLTDISHENHFWGFQSQFHFSLLFLFLSIWFLFNESQSYRNILLGASFSVLSIYSFSAGVVEGLIVLAAFCVFKALRRRYKPEKSREWLQLAIALLIVGGSIALYFADYTKPTSPPFTLPYQKLFWTYYLNLLSGGFGYGYARDNIMPGTIIFFFTLVPIIGVVRQNGYEMSSRKWIIIVSMLAVLGALCSITIGRAGYGKGHSKASRYTEITLMLVPFSVAIWSIFLDGRERLRNYLLIGFWIFCGFGLSRSWNFQKMYSQMASERQKALECVQDYYKNGGEANCPTAYPLPIAERLEFDRDLPLSFIREAQK